MAAISVTAANVQGESGDAIDAGVALTAGQIVYQDTNGKLQLSDANGAAALQAVKGITLNNGAADQPVTIHSRNGAEVTIGGAVLTAGTFYYLSGTPGGFGPASDLTTGWKVIQIGYAKDTNTLVWDLVDTGITL